MIDSYTKLLLPCDGVDASQTFIDIATGKTITPQGTAQIDTAQKKFGTGAGLFDGNSDCLFVPDHDDWNFGSGDFTIDFWARFASVTGVTGLFGQAPATNNLMMFYNNSGRLSVYVRNVGGVLAYYETVDVVVAINTWPHITYVRNGTSFYIFVDGVSKSLTTYNAISTNIIPDYTNSIEIARITDLAGTPKYHNGWLDEFRISKGIARWTANFTPPSRAYGSEGGGVGIGNPWIFMRDIWEKHNKLWTPKLLLPKEGYSY